eukprot:136724-Rhodomonas_salina.1
MDVTTKKRAIDDKDTYKVTSMLVPPRAPRSAPRPELHRVPNCTGLVSQGLTSRRGQVRIPAAHLKVLEEKQKEEAQLTKDFAKENKDKLGKGVIDWNGTIIQFKVDEIGRKQHRSVGVSPDVRGSLAAAALYDCYLST